MGPHVLLFLLIEYSQIVLGNRLWAALLDRGDRVGQGDLQRHFPTSIILWNSSVFPCWDTCSLLATEVFLHTSARLFCQVLSKSRYSFVYPLYSSSLSKNKLLFFCPAHRERKSLFWFCLCHFTVSSQWDKLPCLSFFLPFMPVLKVFEILFSY